MRVQPKKNTQVRRRLKIPCLSYHQLLANLQRPSSELGYATNRGRMSPSALFGLSTRMESFMDRPLSEVFGASAPSRNTSRERSR